MMRGKKLSQVILSIVFLATLCIFLFGTVFSQKNDVSEQEKRRLAKFPTVVWKKKSMAQFPKSLDEYVQDHFFHREELVYLNSLIRVKLLHHSPSFITLAGKDNWYFYLGDWALYDYFGKSGKTDPLLMRSWEKLIAFRQHRMQLLSGNYLAVIAPNKECVYPEYLPEMFPGKTEPTMLEAFSKHMRQSRSADHFLDLQDPLIQAKPTGWIYFKTDSHWNDRGAYIAYRTIMKRIQRWYPEAAALPENRFERRMKDDPSGGDLVLTMGLRGGIGEREEGWYLKQPCASLANNKIQSHTLPQNESLEGNGCPSGIPLRVLLISDSFGDGLQGYLSNTFQKVVYSRDLSFPDLHDYILEYHPEIVIDLRVGRYLPNIMSPGPGERNDLD